MVSLVGRFISSSLIASEIWPEKRGGIWRKRGTTAINFSVHCTLVPSQPGGDRGRYHMVLNLWLHHIKALKHIYIYVFVKYQQAKKKLTEDKYFHNIITNH